ncbi:MAG: hypothetical protein JO107_16955 [Hyphomicrobiales bacterium]|nr:hypothetical protein [Hyphomicrobiales bacterium]MBV8664776.1 hypothetical protein [Hyphomicrobiales bacterium]
MTEYKVFSTKILPTLEEVRLYDETVEHVKESHGDGDFANSPQMPLPCILDAVGNAIVNPTHVERSYGNSVVFVDAASTNRIVGFDSRYNLEEAVMNHPIFINATYDSGSDVLYLTKRREAAVRGVEDKYGIVWRYSERGDVISATVLDFLELWGDNQPSLAHEISLKFDIPAQQAQTVLQSAIDARKAH